MISTPFTKKNTPLVWLLPLLLAACSPKPDSGNDAVALLIDSVRVAHVPDKRVALFEIEAERKGEDHVLKGVTNQTGALDALREGLHALGIEPIDSIELLPSKSLEEDIYGLIGISVANIRSRPSHSAELVTQATMGMPVKVFQKKGSWYRIQTPDQYFGWVDDGGLVRMDKARFEQWRDTQKLIYTQTYGHSRVAPDPNAQVVSDLVAGNILQWDGDSNGFYGVVYPDGKRGFVPKSEAMPYGDWLLSLPMDRDALVATSKTMMGVPYLWGGTSTKGVDCSGFTKTIFFMNGIIIPRDASQQIHQGLLVDDSKDFDKLQKGDLLFFGKKATDSTAERVIHVGMWIGNKEFIHSAGEVHISSVDPDSEHWDPYNLGRYLRTKRFLDQRDGGLVYLRESSLFQSSGSEASNDRGI